MRPLSEAEELVAAHVRTGATNKQIALLLGRSEATVKIHVKGILRKTGYRNRTEYAVATNGTARPLDKIRPMSLRDRMVAAMNSGSLCVVTCAGSDGMWRGVISEVGVDYIMIGPLGTDYPTTVALAHIITFGETL